MAKSFLGLVYAVARKKITDMCYQIVTICIFDKLFFEPTFFLLVPKVLTDNNSTKVSNSWLCCHLLLLMIFFLRMYVVSKFNDGIWNVEPAKVGLDYCQDVSFKSTSKLRTNDLKSSSTCLLNDDEKRQMSFMIFRACEEIRGATN